MGLTISSVRSYRLYKTSRQWERFGRVIAEKALYLVMNNTEGFLFKKSQKTAIQQLIEQHPDIVNTIPLYHIASYLGIKGPSLSRIRKRMSKKGRHVVADGNKDIFDRLVYYYFLCSRKRNNGRTPKNI